TTPSSGGVIAAQRRFAGVLVNK
ncbi:hypothetical protein A2U01_0115904, partial [Trifolium medium]|nr:hypothetical protein [Trifolium medium]